MRLPPKVVVIAIAIASLFAADAVVLLTRGGSAPSVTRAGDPADPTGSARPTKKRDRESDGGSDRPGGGVPSPGEVVAGARGPATPPGLYVHLTTLTVESSNGETDSSDGRTTYAFEPASRRGDAWRQVVVARIEGKDGVETRTNEWRRAGLYRISEETSDGGGEGRTCTYDPPLLMARFPLRVGDSWETDRTACAEGRPQSPTGASFDYEETTSVTGTDTVTIDGVAVECFTIEVAGSGSFSFGTLSGTVEDRSVLWYAPAYRLFVRTESRTASQTTGVAPNGQSADSSQVRTATSILQNLQPR